MSTLKCIYRHYPLLSIQIQPTVFSAKKHTWQLHISIHLTLSLYFSYHLHCLNKLLKFKIWIGRINSLSIWGVYLLSTLKTWKATIKIQKVNIKDRTVEHIEIPLNSTCFNVSIFPNFTSATIMSRWMSNIIYFLRV